MERGRLTVADLAFMSFLPASFGVINGSPVNGPRVDWNRSGGIDLGVIGYDITSDAAISCTDLFDVNDMAIIASDMGLGLPGRP